MKAGIIAAGRGERLAKGSFSVPKPLIPVGGEPLISRVIRGAASVKVTSVACIVNDLNPAVAAYLRSRSWPVPLEVITKTTANSMESLFCLAPLLSEEPFLLFTVDAVFGFGILENFLSEALVLNQAQGVLALTEFIDDENPLWVRTDRRHRIIAMGDEARPSRYATAGFYYFRPDIFAMIDAARTHSLKALREFLAFLVGTGHSYYGLPVKKTMDVDNPEDIQKAEAYLKEIEGWTE